MVDGRSLVGVSLVGLATAFALALVVYLTLGTRWGFETYLFPYVIGASTLPLIGALAARRYRLAVLAVLVPAGVIAFVLGVTWRLHCLQGAGSGWVFAYDVGRNAIRFGPPTATCRAALNAPLVLLGYALATAGATLSVDVVTCRRWSPVSVDALLELP